MAGFYKIELDVIDRRSGNHDVLEFIERAGNEDSAAQKACEFAMGDYNYELMAVESVTYLGTKL